MFYCGIDVGGTKTAFAIADENLKILKKDSFLSEKRSPDDLFSKVVSLLLEMLKEENASFSDVIGIGVCLPGMVGDKELLLHAPFLDWHNIDVIGILRSLTGVNQVHCDCDVNACALAEAAISDYSDFVWMTVSTGIGSAYIKDGKVSRGFHNVAGEIGHCKVEYTNPLKCSCGQLGCAEAQCSGTAMNALVKKECDMKPDLRAVFESKNLPMNAYGCSVLAEEGNEDCKNIVAIIGDYLGRAFSYVINIIDPQCVYMGGGMSKSFDLFYPYIKKRIDSDCVSFVKDTPVIPTKIGYDASLNGSLALAKIK